MKNRTEQNKTKQKQKQKLLTELQKRHYLRHNNYANYKDTLLTFLLLTLKILTLLTSQY